MKRAELAWVLVVVLALCQEARLYWQGQRIADLEHGQAQVTEFMQASANAVKAHAELLHKLTELEKLNALVGEKLERQDADNSAAVVRLAKYFAEHYSPLVERVNLLYDRVYTTH